MVRSDDGLEDILKGRDGFVWKWRGKGLRVVLDG